MNNASEFMFTRNSWIVVWKMDFKESSPSARGQSYRCGYLLTQGSGPGVGRRGAAQQGGRQET